VPIRKVEISPLSDEEFFRQIGDFMKTTDL
jgi:hypothetical protein